MHGPLLISGLSVVALAELLGLVYMKFNGKLSLFLLVYVKISEIQGEAKVGLQL